MQMSQYFEVQTKTSGAFGISENERASTYFFQTPDFSDGFRLLERMYRDLSGLVGRINVKLSKGFEKKLAACSSQILVDMEGKIKILRKTTIEFYEFSEYTKRELSEIIKLIESKGIDSDASPIIEIFLQEFLRQLGNLALAYQDRRDIFSMESYEQCRSMLHERKLDPKYIRLIEGFYQDFTVLSRSIDTFFNRKIPRAFSQTDEGVRVNFVMILRDIHDIVGDLASVIGDVESASKA